MANFLAIIDRDTSRHNEFVRTITPKLSVVEGLKAQSLSSGCFSVVWAAEKRTPVNSNSDEHGAAVIWGNAIRGENSKKVYSWQMANLWANNKDIPKEVFDGFYAGVAYYSQGRVVVGCDLLGVYPVYYWSDMDITLVGSSPELFRYHPKFQAAFNPKGLVGILLTTHLCDGETLLCGVKRLSAGHVLVWQTGKGIEEFLQYKIPVSQKYFNLPFSAHVNILDDAIKSAVSRHLAENKSHNLMLSGGLDSRMLAGYISENGNKAECLTAGLSNDLEMRCAAPVAKALGFSHHRVSVRYDDYPEFTDLETKWRHISNGFNDIMEWGLYPSLRELSPFVVMGHIVDAIIGTRYMTWAYSPASGKMSFDEFFPKANRWAIKPEVLKRLLRKQVFGDLVDQTIDSIRGVYNSYSELESQRAWCFNLYNRQRFHVGSSAWAYSFGAWPVMPALDRRLLETAAAMPASTIAERRAQVELVCKRFPELAALPLDRNSYNTDPLQPRLRQLLLRYVSNHFNPTKYWHRIIGNGKSEHRYYYRIYDFNNAGWQAVRRKAEPNRHLLFDFFERDVLNEILPLPDAKVTFEDSIVDSSGLKLLLGLMLWSKDHL